MEKQKILFEMEICQGYTCGGCNVVDDLTLKVEFTDEEIATMKALISDMGETTYGQGIMPVLEDGAPDLYERMEEAAEAAIFDFLVLDGIRHNYIELDEEELLKNYRKDYGIGKDEEVDDEDFEVWQQEEKNRIECSGLRWIRSRYTVDDQVNMEDVPEYKIDIPVDFIPD